MIKFLAHKDGKPFYGFGLSRGNCELLIQGRPILIDLDVMCMEHAVQPEAMRGTVLLFGAETDEQLIAELGKRGQVPPLIETHTHDQEQADVA